MLYHLTFAVHKKYLQEAFDELQKVGIQDLYVLEDPNCLKVTAGGFAEEIPNKKLSTCKLISSEPAIVNWDQEWETHSPYYQNGSFVIPLQDLGFKTESTLHLKPGPGFGDLSHATTELMLKMMTQMHLPSFYILDIGCGSGILSLAAKAMNAPFTLGIDIDSEAVLHSQKNANLNFPNTQEVSFATSLDSISALSLLVLMNMTFYEQKMAFPTYYEAIKAPSVEMLTSGILQEQKDIYIEWISTYGFKVKELLEKDGWLSFHLER